jgi:hypothetical protein
MRRRLILSTVLTAALVTSTVLNPLISTPAAASYATNDYCLGECSDILPPGENGDADLVQILAHQAFGTMPPHSDDQLSSYANLTYNYTGLTGQQINTFFNDSPYGVPSNDPT